MPGQRDKAGGADYVTPRRTFRENITLADPSVEDVSIEILDTTLVGHKRVGVGQNDISMYGRNCQLNLDLILKGFTSVDLQLWLWAAEEIELVGVSVSSPAADLPVTEEWVKVEDKTITESTHWVVKDIPPGKYKVRVDAVSGAGSLTVREQHAA